MGRYADWKAALEAGRAERGFDRARAAEAMEAGRARDRALELARLQRVRSGVEVHLGPTDWLTMTTRNQMRQVDLVVSTILEPIYYRDGVGWVRVWGHPRECGSNPTTHGPCINVMARVSILLDAVQ